MARSICLSFFLKIILMTSNRSNLSWCVYITDTKCTNQDCNLIITLHLSLFYASSITRMAVWIVIQIFREIISLLEQTCNHYPCFFHCIQWMKNISLTSKEMSLHAIFGIIWKQWYWWFMNEYWVKYCKLNYQPWSSWNYITWYRYAYEQFLAYMTAVVIHQK